MQHNIREAVLHFSLICTNCATGESSSSNQTPKYWYLETFGTITAVYVTVAAVIPGAATGAASVFKYGICSNGSCFA